MMKDEIYEIAFVSSAAISAHAGNRLLMASRTFDCMRI